MTPVAIAKPSASRNKPNTRASMAKMRDMFENKVPSLNAKLANDLL